jgi:DNA invertase Pin-like site-specific DNA recombinase
MVELRQNGSPTRAKARCAVYTRKSSEEGLEQAFNSLDAQREACEAYITSQKHEGWTALATPYDDGAYSGGSMDRPALQRLLDDIRAGKVDVVVVYKVDRLTRSLADFAKIVEIFDAQRVSFVSVTQAFNTTSSMGRLTLNVLLSSPSSSARSRESESATRLRRRRRRACGWAGSRRSATTSRNANLSSTKRKQKRYATSFGVILNLGRCAPCEMISAPGGS